MAVVTRGLARAVASAIRSSVRNLCFPDATVQFAKCSDSPRAQRLAGHALIHSLWRLPLKHTSHVLRNNAFLTETIDAGVHIHPRTLAAHFRRVIDHAPAALPVPSFISTRRSPYVIHLTPSHVRNPPLRAALYLFLRSRDTFHLRTQQVFVSLLTALLQQKEYLAATLLFDKVAQDRALLLTLPDAVEQAKLSASPDYESLKKRLDYLQAEDLVTDLPSLTRIVDHLVPVIEHPSDTTDQTFFHCIQSAIVLGALLDRGHLPEDAKPIVISLLRAVIRSRSVVPHPQFWLYNVYVDIEPAPIAVNAVTYAHQVMMSYLAAQGTTTRLEPWSSKNPMQLEPSIEPS